MWERCLLQILPPSGSPAHCVVVVIDSPAFDGFPCIVQREKSVFVQAFLRNLPWKLSM